MDHLRILERIHPIQVIEKSGVCEIAVIRIIHKSKVRKFALIRFGESIMVHEISVCRIIRSSEGFRSDPMYSMILPLPSRMKTKNGIFMPNSSLFYESYTPFSTRFTASTCLRFPYHYYHRVLLRLKRIDIVSHATDSVQRYRSLIRLCSNNSVNMCSNLNQGAS